MRILLRASRRSHIPGVKQTTTERMICGEGLSELRSLGSYLVSQYQDDWDQVTCVIQDDKLQTIEKINFQHNKQKS